MDNIAFKKALKLQRALPSDKRDKSGSLSNPGNETTLHQWKDFFVSPLAKCHTISSLWTLLDGGQSHSALPTLLSSMLLNHVIPWTDADSSCIMVRIRFRYDKDGGCNFSERTFQNFSCDDPELSFLCPVNITVSKFLVMAVICLKSQFEWPRLV